MAEFRILLNLIIFNYFQTIHGYIEYQVWQSDLLKEPNLSEETQQCLKILNTLDYPELKTTQRGNPFTNKFSSYYLFYQIYWQSDLDNLDKNFKSILNLVANSSFANSDLVYFDQRLYITGSPSKQWLIEKKLSQTVASYLSILMSANMIFRINSQIDEANNRIGVLCYFCLINEKIKWLSFTHQDQSSFQNQLNYVLNKFPRGPMILNSVAGLEIENITNPACRSDKYSHAKYECIVGLMELPLLAEKLNITILPGPPRAILPVSAGLHICTTCEGGAYNALNPVMNAKL